MATAVMNACVEHLRMNFTEVLGTDKFKSMSTVGKSWFVLLTKVESSSVCILLYERERYPCHCASVFY